MTRDNAERKIGAEVRALLHERFPRCFMGRGEPKRPLKQGIKRDIRRHMPELSQRQIFLALADYCGGMSYQLALAERRPRVDLEGNTVEPAVSEQQAAFARECLAKLRPGEALDPFVAPEPALYMTGGKDNG